MKYKFELMTPRVSVILPVYNEEKFIRPTLRSLLQQEFDQEYEIIVIDDGSSDGTTELVREFERDHERILFLRNDENQGITRSLNRGLEQAQGRYIARQDGNDLSSPNRLQLQHDFLKENNDTMLVGTSCTDIDEYGNPYGPGRSVVSDPERIARILPWRNCLIHTSIMFRNAGWRYREKFHYAQDYDLYLRMLTENEKLANIDKRLVKSRHNPGHIGDSKGNVQRLFGEKAKEFYHQRVQRGEDEYQSFDPDDIYRGVDTRSEPHPRRKDMYLYLKNENYIQAWKKFRDSIVEEEYDFEEMLKAIFVLSFPPIYRYCRNSPWILSLM